MRGARPEMDSLERFVRAQDPLIEPVRRELAAGRKVTHWMWFVFPQIRGLGSSPMAQRYAIASLEEAVAYLQHPILGARLAECAGWVTAVQARPIEAILAYPDNLKFHSCMTLFAHAAVRANRPADGAVFRAAIEKYFGGREDARTLERVAALRIA
jgi:uncharacterized protein (DUF1810 family)